MNFYEEPDIFELGRVEVVFVFFFLFLILNPFCGTASTFCERQNFIVLSFPLLKGRTNDVKLSNEHLIFYIHKFCCGKRDIVENERAEK